MIPSPDDTWDPAPAQNGSLAGKYSSNGIGEVDAERGYWKRLETVEVGLISEKEGWFLQKYKIKSDVSRARCRRPGRWLKSCGHQKRTAEPVSRRYSDFVWLLDCLVKRYVCVVSDSDVDLTSRVSPSVCSHRYLPNG